MKWSRRALRVGVVVGLVGGMSGLGYAADGVEPTLTEALTQGRTSVDVRLRYETADQDGLSASDALTIRPRIGYGTLPYKGVTAFVEMEHVQAIGAGNAYNQAGTNPGGAGQTVIADIEGAELNRAFIAAECPLTHATVKLGRQRIKLNNDRFVGNVGWRQNEQTYDAAAVTFSTFEPVDVLYAYVDGVNRIFGDANGTRPAGARANAANFDSASHLIHVTAKPCDAASITAYAYLLDLGSNNLGATNSSDTVGVRLTAGHEVRDGLAINYEAEYARQADNSATPAARDYEADYLRVALSCKSSLGVIGGGYEVLGSDNGIGFGTPLATLHAHNGWADVFLATPGGGLEDRFVYASTTLPADTKAKVVYHAFAAETGGVDYGTELDLVVSKAVNEHVTLLAKVAAYDAAGDAGNPRSVDVEKVIIQASLTF